MLSFSFRVAWLSGRWGGDFSPEADTDCPSPVACKSSFRLIEVWSVNMGRASMDETSAIWGGANSRPSNSCRNTVKNIKLLQRQRRLDDMRELSLSDRWCPNLADVQKQIGQTSMQPTATTTYIAIPNIAEWQLTTHQCFTSFYILLPPYKQSLCVFIYRSYLARKWHIHTYSACCCQATHAPTWSGHLSHSLTAVTAKYKIGSSNTFHLHHVGYVAFSIIFSVPSFVFNDYSTYSLRAHRASWYIIYIIYIWLQRIQHPMPVSDTTLFRVGLSFSCKCVFHIWCKHFKTSGFFTSGSAKNPLLDESFRNSGAASLHLFKTFKNRWLQGLLLLCVE